MKATKSTPFFVSVYPSTSQPEKSKIFCNQRCSEVNIRLAIVEHIADALYKVAEELYRAYLRFREISVDRNMNTVAVMHMAGSRFTANSRVLVHLTS